VHLAGDAWHWSADAFPAEGVSLRSANADNVVIVDVTRGARVVGEMDQFSAPVFLHEEAIYLHEGLQYHVDRLDWNEKKAYVRPVKVDYYTDANLAVSIKVLQTLRSDSAQQIPVHHGEVRVTFCLDPDGTPRFRIVVVDDGSRDGTGDAARTTADATGIGGITRGRRRSPDQPRAPSPT